MATEMHYTDSVLPHKVTDCREDRCGTGTHPCPCCDGKGVRPSGLDCLFCDGTGRVANPS
jgi:hypothetical protein